MLWVIVVIISIVAITVAIVLLTKKKNPGCIPTCPSNACGIICGGENGCGGTCSCPSGQTCTNGACIPPSGCQKQCQGKVCGSDCCGGVCGTCPDKETCSEDGTSCIPCKPNCLNKKCGDDGCGGSCGSCPSNMSCVNGQCIPCQPNCGGRTCGDDGCGGQCGKGTGPGGCASNCFTCNNGFCEPIPPCNNGTIKCGTGPCGEDCGKCQDGYNCINGQCDSQCNLSIYDQGLMGYVLDNNGSISIGPSNTPTNWIVDNNQGSICSPINVGMCWNKTSNAYVLGNYDPILSTNLDLTQDNFIVAKDTKKCLDSALTASGNCQQFKFGGDTSKCNLSQPISFYCDPVKGPTPCTTPGPNCQSQAYIDSHCIYGFSPTNSNYYSIYGYTNPSFTGSPMFLNAGSILYGTLQFMKDPSTASIFYYDGKKLAVVPNTSTVPTYQDDVWLEVLGMATCKAGTPLTVKWGTINGANFTISGNTLSITGTNIVLQGASAGMAINLGAYCPPLPSSFPLYVKIAKYCAPQWCMVGDPNCFSSGDC